MFFHRLFGFFFKLEVQPIDESLRAKDAQGVFLDSGLGIPDEANDSVSQILEPMMEIEDVGVFIDIKRVNREVSSIRILFWVFDELDEGGMPRIGVTPFFAKGRDIDIHTEGNVFHRSKPREGEVRGDQEGRDFLGGRIGDEIIIRGLFPKQEISAGAADHI